MLFTFSAYEGIAQPVQTIPSLRGGQFTVGCYGNQELHASIEGPVFEEHCLILGQLPLDKTLAFKDKALRSLAWWEDKHGSP